VHAHDLVEVLRPAGLVLQAAHALGPDGSGRNRVHADAAFSPFDCEVLGEP
jgi:hypothetical protein